MSKIIFGNLARKESYNYENDNIEKKVTIKRTYIKKREKLNIVPTICLLFVILVFITYRYAIITEIKYECHKKEIELKKIMNENQEIQSNIDSKTELNVILEKAEGLGLMKPEADQKRYVNIPKKDFTIIDEKYKNTED